MPCGFLPQGFAESPHLGPMLFLLLLAVHLATPSRNLLILVAVALVPSRPPMLLFLCQLSAIELCYMLAVVPRSLAHLASQAAAEAAPSPSWAALFRCRCLWLWAGPSASCWPLWPMTATWPSATRCATRLWWHLGCARSWPWPAAASGDWRCPWGSRWPSSTCLSAAPTC